MMHSFAWWVICHTCFWEIHCSLSEYILRLGSKGDKHVPFMTANMLLYLQPCDSASATASVSTYVETADEDWKRNITSSYD